MNIIDQTDFNSDENNKTMQQLKLLMKILRLKKRMRGIRLTRVEKTLR